MTLQRPPSPALPEIFVLMSAGMLAVFGLSGISFFSHEAFAWVFACIGVVHLFVVALAGAGLSFRFIFIHCLVCCSSLLATVLHIYLASGGRSVNLADFFAVLYQDLLTWGGIASTLHYIGSRLLILFAVVLLVMAILRAQPARFERFLMLAIAASSVNIGLEVAIRRPVAAVSVWHLDELQDSSLAAMFLVFEQPLIFFLTLLVSALVIWVSWSRYNRRNSFVS